MNAREERAYRAARERGLGVQDAVRSVRYARTVQAFAETFEQEQWRERWTRQDGLWTITVEAERDECAGRPEDNGDCYDADDIKAWENDEWSYYVVTVTARGGQYEGDDSLGGVDAGDYYERFSGLYTSEQIMAVVMEHDMIQIATEAAMADARMAITGALR